MKNVGEVAPAVTISRFGVKLAISEMSAAPIASRSSEEKAVTEFARATSSRTRSTRTPSAVEPPTIIFSTPVQTSSEAEVLWARASATSKNGSPTTMSNQAHNERIEEFAGVMSPLGRSSKCKQY